MKLIKNSRNILSSILFWALYCCFFISFFADRFPAFHGNVSLHTMTPMQDQLNDKKRQIYWLTGNDSYLKRIHLSIKGSDTAEHNLRHVKICIQKAEALEGEKVQEYETVIYITPITGTQQIDLIVPNIKLIFGREYWLTAENLPDGDADITVETVTCTGIFIVLLRLLILIYLPAWSLCGIRNFSFPLSLVIVALGETLFLYLSALIGYLVQGFWGICAAALIAVAADRVYFRHTHTAMGNIPRSLASFGAAIGLTLILLITCCRLSVTKGDDFVHWALWVKETYMYDRLPIHDKSTIYSLRYPPFYGLMQYLFMKMNGGYSEWILFFAKRWMEGMIVLAVLNKSRNKWIKIFSPVIAILLPYLCFSADIVDSTYPDIFVGSLCGIALIVLFQCLRCPNIENTILLFLLSFLLPLCKEIGICIVGILSIISVFVCVFSRKHAYRKIPLVVISGAILANMSWQNYIRYISSFIQGSDVSERQLSTSAATRISLDSFANFVTGKGFPYQYSTIGHFVKALFSKPIVMRNGVPLTYYMYLLLIVAFVVGAIRQGTVKKQEGNLFLAYILAAAHLLAYCLLPVYIFMFTAKEAENLAALERYLGSFLYAMGIACIYFRLSFESAGNQKSNRGYALWLGLLCLITVPSEAKYAIKCIINGNTEESMLPAFQMQNMRKIIQEKDPIYFISSSGGINCEWHKFQYELAPVKINSRWFYDGHDYYVSYMPSTCQNSPDTYYMTETMLLHTLAEYRYLYIGDITDQFAAEYPSIISMIGKDCSDTLYQIHTSEEHITLHKVEGFF